MSKYNRFFKQNFDRKQYHEDGSLRSQLDPGEAVLWKGKADTVGAFFNHMETPMTPFALIWMAVDLAVLGPILRFGIMDLESLLFIVPFFLVHMIPVWIWIGMMVKSVVQIKRTVYVITDRRVLINDGMSYSLMYTQIKFSQIQKVEIHRGLMDKVCNVGDLELHLQRSGTEYIADIIAYNDIYQLLNNAIEEYRSNKKANKNNSNTEAPTVVVAEKTMSQRNNKNQPKKKSTDTKNVSVEKPFKRSPKSGNLATDKYSDDFQDLQ